jgi:hypothetical protein
VRQVRDPHSRGGEQPEQAVARGVAEVRGWSNACAAEQSAAQVLELTGNAGAAACRLGEPGAQLSAVCEAQGQR